MEFALVLPLLMVLLLGIVSAGLLWNTRLQMSHATREGARFGSTVPVDQEFTSGTWASNVRSIIVNRSAGDLDDADVCVALVVGATPVVFGSDAEFTTRSDGAPCYDDSDIGDESLRVQVAATTSKRLETGLWSRDVDLEVEATARHEQAGDS